MEMAVQKSITEGATPVPAPAEKAAKITARNVNVFYGEKHALRDVSVDIAEKGVMAFIGPSGCGKSTFLRCINRMNEFDPKLSRCGQDRNR